MVCALTELSCVKITCSETSFNWIFSCSGLTAGVRRPSDTRDVYLNQNISQLKRYLIIILLMHVE